MSEWPPRSTANFHFFSLFFIFFALSNKNNDLKYKKVFAGVKKHREAPFYKGNISKMSNIIIIYDTESTCWGKKDGSPSWWSEDWQEPEIIQMAAIKIETDNFTEIAEPFNVLVKPTINPDLSDYCTKLTSITDQQLDNEGVSFLEACRLFKAYCGEHVQHSYGGDHEVMNYNLKDLYNLTGQMPLFTGRDISKLFHKIDPATKTVNSGGLSKHFQLAFKVNEHYALDDCRSINASLQHFKTHQEVLSYFSKP